MMCTVDWQPVVAAVAGFIVVLGPAIAAYVMAVAAHRKASAGARAIAVNSARLGAVEQVVNGGVVGLGARVGVLERRADAQGGPDATNTP